MLLWLGSRLAATALIRHLAWEPPYATLGAALKRQKKKKKFGHIEIVILPLVSGASEDQIWEFSLWLSGNESD